MLRSALLASLLAGCGFHVSAGDHPAGGDGGADMGIDAFVPDAGPCQQLGATCAGGQLRTCTIVDQQPTIETCDWTCSSTAPGPRCTLPTPSGGAVLPTDLGPDATLAPTTLAATTIDTGTGAISGVRAAGTGIISGIDFEIRTLASSGSVGVFRFGALTINGPVDFTGANAVAFVSTGPIAIGGPIDVRGTCTGVAAGPGGFAGAGHGANGLGTGGGTKGGGPHDACSGGGGGGYGTAGADGGRNAATPTNPAGGIAYGDAQITSLVGGSGGGGGGGGKGGSGGGGGGALQLVTAGTITIAATASINASGCGARRKSDQTDAGGGGGAGGTVLVEGLTITLASSASLAVNGGSGGGGDDPGTDGAAGTLGRSQVAGGLASGGNGGDGGGGGAAVPTGVLGGSQGQNASNSGGGGGAVGRIRFNTRSGAITNGGATLSPNLIDASTTTTQGTMSAP